MKYFICTISTIAIFSAHAYGQATTHLKDKIVAQYIALKDSLGGIDTSDENYKVLKAYVSGDYSFLLELQKKDDKISKSIKNKTRADSILHLQKLQNIGADEAYRFIYSVPGMLNVQNITISKTGNSYCLRYVYYAYGSTFANGYYAIKDTTALLKWQDWYILQNAIEMADFWGLKQENGVSGFEGDNLYMSGYKKQNLSGTGPAEYSSIHRWGPNNTYIGKVLDIAFKLAGAHP